MARYRAWAVLGKATAAFTVTNVDAFVVLTLLLAAAAALASPGPQILVALSARSLSGLIWPWPHPGRPVRERRSRS